MRARVYPRSAGAVPAVLLCAGLMSGLGVGLGAAPAAGQTFDTSAGAVRVERVAGPLEHPWSLAFLPDGRMLVTERPGRVSLVGADGAVVRLSGAPEVRARGQGGLFDIALAPDYARSGLVYLSYAEPAGEGISRTALARARLALEGAPRLEDLRVIFRQTPAVDSRRHYGGRIAFAPNGDVFLTLGERGERPMAQALDNHFGKVVRVTPQGAPAAGNPFLGRADALPEIWSYGHRNPQGAALDPQSGALWIVEHGAQGGDELNRPEPGRNYGWPEISYGRHYSGARIGVGSSAPGMEQPVHYWDPSVAPSGLAVYQGALFPQWRGDLFVGALSFQLIARLDMQGDRVAGEERLFEGAFGRVRDVRAGPDGALWFLTDEPDGGVYRVAPAG